MLLFKSFIVVVSLASRSSSRYRELLAVTKKNLSRSRRSRYRELLAVKKGKLWKYYSSSLIVVVSLTSRSKSLRVTGDWRRKRQGRNTQGNNSAP